MRSVIRWLRYHRPSAIPPRLVRKPAPVSTITLSGAEVVNAGAGEPPPHDSIHGSLPHMHRVHSYQQFGRSSVVSKEKLGAREGRISEIGEIP